MGGRLRMWWRREKTEGMMASAHSAAKRCFRHIYGRNARLHLIAAAYGRSPQSPPIT